MLAGDARGQDVAHVVVGVRRPVGDHPAVVVVLRVAAGAAALVRRRVVGAARAPGHARAAEAPRVELRERGALRVHVAVRVAVAPVVRRVLPLRLALLHELAAVGRLVELVPRVVRVELEHVLVEALLGQDLAHGVHGAEAELEPAEVVRRDERLEVDGRPGDPLDPRFRLAVLVGGGVGDAAVHGAAAVVAAEAEALLRLLGLAADAAADAVVERDEVLGGGVAQDLRVAALLDLGVDGDVVDDLARRRDRHHGVAGDAREARRGREDEDRGAERRPAPRGRGGRRGVARRGRTGGVEASRAGRWRGGRRAPWILIPGSPILRRSGSRFAPRHSPPRLTRPCPGVRRGLAHGSSRYCSRGSRGRG